MNPANMVWIFCTSRSGSTWLRSMLAELTGAKVWEEPKVGQLFGNFYDAAQKGQLGSTNFILGEPTRRGLGPLHPQLYPGRRLLRPAVYRGGETTW